MAKVSEIRTGAYPDKTPDGRDVVYVAMPSIETTREWERTQRKEREARKAELEVNTRIHALQHAREVYPFKKYDEETAEERAKGIIAIAEVFEGYLGM